MRLMVEGVSFNVTSINEYRLRTPVLYISDNNMLHNHCCENLDSANVDFTFHYLVKIMTA
jgi:hypothetical protein